LWYNVTWINDIYLRQTYINVMKFWHWQENNPGSMSNIECKRYVWLSVKQDISIKYDHFWVRLPVEFQTKVPEWIKRMAYKTVCYISRLWCILYCYGAFSTYSGNLRKQSNWFEKNICLLYKHLIYTQALNEQNIFIGHICYNWYIVGPKIFLLHYAYFVLWFFFILHTCKRSRFQFITIIIHILTFLL
jgi:hypothetical protein